MYINVILTQQDGYVPDVFIPQTGGEVDVVPRRFAGDFFGGINAH